MLSVYYTERKPKNENRGGRGTRLRCAHIDFQCMKLREYSE